MTAKRHLPVLAATPQDEGLKLSNLQWILLCALGIFLFWLPLGMLGLFSTAVLSRWLHAGPALRMGATQPWVGLLTVLPLLLSFAMAAFFGAALLGRYASGYRPRSPVYAGLLAAFFSVALTITQGARRPLGFAAGALFVLGSVAAISAFWGGRWGRRFRP